MQTGTPFNVTADINNVIDGNNPVYASCVSGVNPHAGATTQSQSVHDHGDLPQSVGVYGSPLSGHFGTCAPYQFYGPGNSDVGLEPF